MSPLVGFKWQNRALILLNRSDDLIWFCRPSPPHACNLHGHNCDFPVKWPCVPDRQLSIWSLHYSGKHTKHRDCHRFLLFTPSNVWSFIRMITNLSRPLPSQLALLDVLFVSFLRKEHLEWRPHIVHVHKDRSIHILSCHFIFSLDHFQNTRCLLLGPHL